MSEPTGGDMTAAFSAALESASTAPAAETSPVSTPVTETAPAETSAPAATTQAASETPAPESASADDPPKGEPPTWRWQDILEKNRKEHYERGRQEVEAQYADFKGLDADQRRGLVIWNRALNGDPSALAQVAHVNPALAAALSGKAPETQTQPEPEPQPDAAIQLADGSTVPVYTPEGMKKREAWLQKQLGSTLEQQLSEKFKPLMTAAERERQREEAEAQQRQTLEWAARTLKPYRRSPLFEEFKPQILKAIAEMPKDFAGDLEEYVADEFNKLLDSKLKTLTTTGEAKALASIHQRTVAGTTNPNAASATAPKKFRPGVEGFQEALSHFNAG